MSILPTILTNYDLSTELGLQAYLVDTPFAASSVIRLSGGFSSYTFRAILDVPYEDRESALVSRSVIIKHIRDHSAIFKDVPLSIERMGIEIAALRTIPALPFFQNNCTSPKICLARVLAHDQTNHVVIIEDFGTLPSLKDYILAATTSTPEACTNATTTAQEIGKILGQFLAHLHLWGYKLLHPTESHIVDDSALNPFRNNPAVAAAKQLCAWRTAGRLSETASKYEDMGNECDWNVLAKRLEDDVLEKEETFTMGDLWTGNILVKTSMVDDSRPPVLEQLVILDWEIAKLGISAADIGQFAAESLLLARYATSHGPGRALVGNFLESYEATLISEVNGGGMQDRKAFATLFDANAIVGCTSAHAAVWGTLGQWNIDREVKKETVRGALKVCARSARGEFEGLGAKNMAEIWDGE